jgi:NAD(P)H-hydrate epimerase
MKAIDEAAINNLGIPGIILMENAAVQTVEKASKLLNGKKDAKVTIVAGDGNNGGDAFAVTRHLLSMGYTISIFSMKEVDKLSGDALINGRILKNIGMYIPVISDDESLERLQVSCLESDLVIDGLLGTGLNRDVEGVWAKVINIVNHNASRVLSIDIASGVDGLTGKVRGNCIKADATVTFFLPKLGMVQYPGASFIGELTVADIGIPYALADNFDTPELIGKDYVANILPLRPQNGHKGTFGKILVIAGSNGMTGSAYLSALSAYKTGTGLVRLVVPEICMETLSLLIPEAVLSHLPQKDGHICLDSGDLSENQELLKKLLEGADAVLVGPGLSCNDDTLKLLRVLIECCEKPMVIDADALNLLARDKSMIENLKCEAIITPHPAEMARLNGVEVSAVQADRMAMAQHFADEYGLTVVLKGAGTIIAANDGRVAVNPTGNEGMATAGSGDVLAGMITSLLGQGLLPYDAAVAGVYLHGLAGDFAAHELGSVSVMASDIASHISHALKGK